MPISESFFPSNVRVPRTYWKSIPMAAATPFRLPSGPWRFIPNPRPPGRKFPGPCGDFAEIPGLLPVPGLDPSRAEREQLAVVEVAVPVAIPLAEEKRREHAGWIESPREPRTPRPRPPSGPARGLEGLVSLGGELELEVPHLRGLEETGRPGAVALLPRARD